MIQFSYVLPCWDLDEAWIPAAWPSPAIALRHLPKTARPSAAQCGAAHRIVPQLGLGQRRFVLCLLQPEIGLQLLHRRHLGKSRGRQVQWLDELQQDIEDLASRCHVGQWHALLRSSAA